MVQDIYVGYHIPKVGKCYTVMVTFSFCFKFILVVFRKYCKNLPIIVGFCEKKFGEGRKVGM